MICSTKLNLIMHLSIRGLLKCTCNQPISYVNIHLLQETNGER
jgi:hypothetical protein